MLITALETRLLAADLPIVFRAGTYEVARRSAVLCRISTDEGLRAEVCVGNEFGYSDFFFELLCGPFRDLLVGQDPLEIERHWNAMLGQATGPWPAMATSIYMYLPDCDAVYRKALEAGGTSVQEPKTQFYGDRHAAVKDPCGNTWWPATHVEDVPPQELEKRAADAARQRQAQAN